MTTPIAQNAWTSLPYKYWAETSAALHLWTQILGKYRVAHTPWVNHARHSTLHVTPRGMATGPVHEGRGCMSLTLDFVDHVFIAEADSGARAEFPLKKMSVATFYDRAENAVTKIGGTFDIHGAPNELPDATPFAKDTATRPYDADAVRRFHRALLQMVPDFERFRTGFAGKVSPVHFFWGSFDLAVIRFSGRPAPPSPRRYPELARCRGPRGLQP